MTHHKHDEKKNDSAAEVKADAPAADAAAAPQPDAMNGAPTPDMIKQQMEGHARMLQAGATLAFISNQAQNMLTMLTNNNPRMMLAICNELVLINEEVIRRMIVVNNGQQPAQDNQPSAAGEAQPEKAAEGSDKGTAAA